MIYLCLLSTGWGEITAVIIKLILKKKTMTKVTILLAESFDTMECLPPLTNVHCPLNVESNEIMRQMHHSLSLSLFDTLETSKSVSNRHWGLHD